MTHWTMRRTQWGWSLFYDGALVASADDPINLFRCQLTVMMVKGGSVA